MANPKEPEVILVQLGVPELAPVTVPVILTVGLLRQTFLSAPAFTVGTGTGDRTILSFTGLQFP